MAKTLSFQPLTDYGVNGLNTQNNPSTLDSTWLTSADNIVLRESGRISFRKGLKQKVVPSGTAIGSLVEHNDQSESPPVNKIFASHGTSIYMMDFTSPNDHYRCVINISLDSGSWAANDIIAIIIRGNGENLAQYKWTVNATTIGSPQTIFPLSVILPPNTVFRVVFAMSSATAMVGSAGAVLVGK